MIQQLLSFFDPYKSKYFEISTYGKENNSLKSYCNFFYGNKVLIILTLGWLVYKVYLFESLSGRPAELFIPMTYFSKVFMPIFPSKILYFLIAAFAFVLGIIIFIRPQLTLLRIILTLLLLWINILQWSYGYLSHVGHLFLLAHLFSIFMPYRYEEGIENSKKINSAIAWYYAGLLYTYSFSGIWKFIGLFYKLLIKPNDVNWISPEGALYNAIISFRNYDLFFLDMEKYFLFPAIWQICFIFMLYMQIFCIVAIFRLPLQVWVGVFLLIFHLVNEIFFETTFILAPMVVVCIFFPYYLFIPSLRKNLKEIIEKRFEGNKWSAQYDRIYKDGTYDRFTGFYAFREYSYDKNPILGGLLYFPWLEKLIHFKWKYFNRAEIKMIGL